MLCLASPLLGGIAPEGLPASKDSGQLFHDDPVFECSVSGRHDAYHPAPGRGIPLTFASGAWWYAYASWHPLTLHSNTGSLRKS